MSQYRKKPVVIEAYEVPHPDPGYQRAEVPTWMMQAIIDAVITLDPLGGAHIKTLEGTMRANVGDWIIQGVKSEFYPCKPDIFAATYEPASASLRETSETPLERLAAQLESLTATVNATVPELRAALDAATLGIESRDAVLAMTVARLGGTVEGQPTHRKNFLQRVDELREIEQRAALQEAQHGR